MNYSPVDSKVRLMGLGKKKLRLLAVKVRLQGGNYRLIGINARFGVGRVESSF